MLELDPEVLEQVYFKNQIIRQFRIKNKFCEDEVTEAADKETDEEK